MTHYTCTECGNESAPPKKCDDPDCLREGQTMTTCDCTDGEHGADDDEGYYAH